MKNLFVIYNSTEVIWCYENEAFEKIAQGWVLYAVTDNETEAEKLLEKACYV